MINFIPNTSTARDVSSGDGAMMIDLQDWRPPRDVRQPLSELDWRVVEMARTDGPRSLNPDGMIARFERFIGVRFARSLANDGLEALRRFSVRAWYWDWIRDKDLRALFDAGYSRFHVLEILSHVGMSRGFTPSLLDGPAPVSPRKLSSHCRCG